MQKNGAGLHTASSCFWDNTTDGTYACIRHSAILTNGQAHLFLLFFSFFQEAARLDGRIRRCIVSLACLVYRFKERTNERIKRVNNNITCRVCLVHLDSFQHQKEKDCHHHYNNNNNNLDPTRSNYWLLLAYQQHIWSFLLHLHLLYLLLIINSSPLYSLFLEINNKPFKNHLFLLELTLLVVT